MRIEKTAQENQIAHMIMSEEVPCLHWTNHELWLIVILRIPWCNCKLMYNTKFQGNVFMKDVLLSYDIEDIAKSTAGRKNANCLAAYVALKVEVCAFLMVEAGVALLLVVFELHKH